MCVLKYTVSAFCWFSQLKKCVLSSGVFLKLIVLAWATPGEHQL